MIEREKQKNSNVYKKFKFFRKKRGKKTGNNAKLCVFVCKMQDKIFNHLVTLIDTL